MAEDQGKEEEKFDFTPEGEAVGYISLDQARVLAMRHARGRTQTSTVRSTASRSLPGRN